MSDRMRPLSGIRASTSGIGKGVKPRAQLMRPEIEDPIEAIDVTVKAAHNAVREAREKELLRMELGCDAAFYFVAIFDSRDQKLAYLRAKGLGLDGDLYVDGRKLADLDGIPIPAIAVAMPNLMRPDRKLSVLSMPLKRQKPRPPSTREDRERAEYARLKKLYG